MVTKNGTDGFAPHIYLDMTDDKIFTWFIVRQETFLSVNLFLSWFMHMSWFATVNWELSALLEPDHLAVLPGSSLAVGGALHVAVEGVGHAGEGLWLWLMIPNVLLVIAGDFRNDEVNLFWDKLAFKPSNWFT